MAALNASGERHLPAGVRVTLGVPAGILGKKRAECSDDWSIYSECGLEVAIGMEVAFGCDFRRHFFRSRTRATVAQIARGSSRMVREYPLIAMIVGQRLRRRRARFITLPTPTRKATTNQ